MQSTQVPRTGVSASSFAQGYLQGKWEDVITKNIKEKRINQNSTFKVLIKYIQDLEALDKVTFSPRTSLVTPLLMIS